MAEEVKKDVNLEEKEAEKKQNIDLDLFDEKKDKPKDETNELEILKEELEKEKAEKEKALERARKFKDSFDKKASEAAALTAKLRDTEKEVEAPVIKLTELEQQLAEYELKERKTNLLYSLTESLAIGKEMSEKIVQAIYPETTNELSIADLELALRELVDEIRTISYQKGYDTRDIELASGKPRSLGKQETLSLADKKRQEYLEKTKRR